MNDASHYSDGNLLIDQLINMFSAVRYLQLDSDSFSDAHAELQEQLSSEKHACVTCCNVFFHV